MYIWCGDLNHDHLHKIRCLVSRVGLPGGWVLQQTNFYYSLMDSLQTLTTSSSTNLNNIECPLLNAVPDEESKMDFDFTVVNRKRKGNLDDSSNKRSTNTSSPIHKHRNKSSTKFSNVELDIKKSFYENFEKPNELCCLIDNGDSAKENLFSQQPLRLLEVLITQALDINSTANNKVSIFKINKFKKARSKVFTTEIKLYSEEHLSKLLSLNKIGEFDVKVKENFDRNCTKGTIYDSKSWFEGESDDSILKYIHGKGYENIVEAKRLGKSKVISLTFRGQSRPKEVDLKVKSFPVWPFYRRPSRCFKCQSYSHSQSRCKSDVFRCYNCALSYSSESDHSPKKCADSSADKKCVHCEDKHSTGFKECPIEKSEVKFQKIMVDLKISRHEAQSRFPDGEVKPYSIIASQPTVISNPPSQINTTSPQFQFELASKDCNQSINLSLLMDQNKDILERLEKVDNYIFNKSIPLKQADIDKSESVDLKNLKEIIDTQARNMEQLTERMNSSDRKIEVLEATVKEKDNIIADQSSEIEQLKLTISQLKEENTSVAPSIAPNEKFLELEKRNQELEEGRIKALNEIIGLKAKLASNSSSHKLSGSSSQHSSSGSSSQHQSRTSSQHSRDSSSQSSNQHSRDSSSHNRKHKS